MAVVQFASQMVPFRGTFFLPPLHVKSAGIHSPMGAGPKALIVLVLVGACFEVQAQSQVRASRINPVEGPPPSRPMGTQFCPLLRAKLAGVELADTGSLAHDRWVPLAFV